MRSLLLASLLLLRAALAADGEPALGISGVPEDLFFPIPAGKNAVLTATVEGARARTVWLAASRESSGRYLLTRTGEGTYQGNLADPVVAALAESAGAGGTLRVFAECEDGRVVESIAIRYRLAKEPAPPLRIHVVAKGRRRALSLRRIDALASLLDREARGQPVEPWERWTARADDPGPDGWLRPAEIEAIEVRCRTRRPVEAECGGLDVRLEPAADGETHSLMIDDALREAWVRAGVLTLTCPVGEREVPIGLRAVPVALDPEGAAAGVRVHQRSSAEVPGSRGYLRVSIDDIRGPRVPLSLTNGEGKTLVDDAILTEGDEVRFDLGERHYKAVVERLVNELIGEDYIRLVVREIPAAELDGLSRTQERIEALLRAIDRSDAIFVREGKEYSGKEAADHIRGKYAVARKVVRSVDEFIDRVAGASWTTGEEYRVRPKGGEETGAKGWLRAEARRIEGGPEKE